MGRLAFILGARSPQPFCGDEARVASQEPLEMTVGHISISGSCPFWLWFSNHWTPSALNFPLVAMIRLCTIGGCQSCT